MTLNFSDCWKNKETIREANSCTKAKRAKCNECKEKYHNGFYSAGFPRCNFINNWP